MISIWLFLTAGLLMLGGGFFAGVLWSAHRWYTIGWNDCVTEYKNQEPQE